MQAKDRTNYLGPLFVNPGGPGDAGTDFLIRGIDSLIEQAGPGYDIVTWDPRASGSTLPPLACFPDQESRDEALEGEEHLWLYNDNDTLAKVATRQQTTAAGCRQYSRYILPHMGTMATVRDLNLMNRLYGFSEDLTYL